jgi:hypothetical protein
MSDPLDDFLDCGVSCEPADALRQTLRARTTGVLRRRRRLNKLAGVGALVACFLAGMATMYALVPRVPIAGQPASEAPAVAVHKVDPAPVEQPAQSARAIELAADTQPDRRAARLRQAGDLYLQQEQDYAAALRCYTQALDTGDAQALAFSPDDTWLEMALKDARRKEKALAH